MNDNKTPLAATAADEPMVDARQACYALRLPYYWFANPQMRSAKRIPHYQFCRLVRFRLSELAAWHAKNAERFGNSASVRSGGGA